MMRLAKSEVKQIQSRTGEIDCLVWKKIKFSWSENINNVDQYVVEGCFVGISPKYMYEGLTISANFKDNIFYLKTGHGKIITWINLLDL